MLNEIKNEELISIIVPVYNAENTLERCVSSICNQTYRNLEIILVNDGSVDNSLNICKKISREDERVRVISQSNAGVSAARNMGIMSAQGVYIGFVDSDDWIDSDMYSSMYKHMHRDSAELVLCNYTQVYGEKYIKRYELNFVKENTNQLKDEVLSKIISVQDNNIMGACWRILIFKELLSQNNITFDLGIKMSEDMMFVIKCVDAANRISLDNNHLYYYFMNASSATAKYIKNIWEDMMLLIDWCNKNILGKYPNLSIDECLKECTTNAVIVAVSNACKRGTPWSFLERIKYCKNICKQQFVSNAIKTTWKKRDKFNKKIWPQIICIALKCNWMVVLYHSLKHRTILVKGK